MSSDTSILPRSPAAGLTGAGRLPSIDALRRLVILVMLIDQVRETFYPGPRPAAGARF
ncbi:hypothetical protein ACQYWY_14155 [Comamonas sediminis]|uniref:hypothetical protein n=1 Tax=Comamonas sediminis TaxID=1783360 RepID=UPI003D2DC77A